MNIENAILIAAHAHAGQTRWNGEPFIYHPQRVADRFECKTTKMVAWLHDVVEDTSYTLEDLKSEGFPPVVIEAVDALTKRHNETYNQYIDRVSKNFLAKLVKIADLEDNLNVLKMPELTDKVLKTIRLKHEQWKKLTK